MAATSDSQENKSRYIFEYQSSVTQQFHGSRTASRNAAFLLPHLRPGMSLLDCGCGAGSITVGLAERVTPGEVVGVDISESQIEKAREIAINDNILNLRFDVASIYDLPFPSNSFDAVFSHAVLEHLDDPIRALKEMRRVLKPGGVIGIRNVDSGGALVFGPGEKLIWDGIRLITSDYEVEEGDPYLGRRHRMLLRQAGFEQILASASYDAYPDQQSQAWFMNVIASRFEDLAFVERCVNRGLADEETLRTIAGAWREFGQSEDAFANIPYCEAVAWKQDA